MNKKFYRHINMALVFICVALAVVCTVTITQNANLKSEIENIEYDNTLYKSAVDIMVERASAQSTLQRTRIFELADEHYDLSGISFGEHYYGDSITEKVQLFNAHMDEITNDWIVVSKLVK